MDRQQSTIYKGHTYRQRNFLIENNVNTKYNIRLKSLEYNSLKCAIPSKWKKTLRNNSNEISNIITDHDCRLTCNKIPKLLEEVTTKEINKLIIGSKSQRPTSEKNEMDRDGIVTN